MFIQNFNFHQEDVQGFSINEIPKNAKKISKTFFAKSEKSGHCHAMCGDYDLYEYEDSFIVNVKENGAILNHTLLSNLNDTYWDSNKTTEIADHKPTILSKGIYRIGIQRQYNPFEEIWKKVID